MFWFLNGFWLVIIILQLETFVCVTIFIKQTVRAILNTLSKYCYMITWSVARQQFGKHISATVDMHATSRGIVGNGVFYAVHAEAI